MATHTETDNYKMETTRNGLIVVVTRKSDGADVHFQDDAAAQVLRVVEELGDCWADNTVKFNEFFDHMMSAYDELMDVRDQY